MHLKMSSAKLRPFCYIFFRIVACHRSRSTVIAVNVCHRFGKQLLVETVQTYCQLDRREHFAQKFYSKFKHLRSGRCTEIIVFKMSTFCSGPVICVSLLYCSILSQWPCIYCYCIIYSCLLFYYNKKFRLHHQCWCFIFNSLRPSDAYMHQ